MSENPAGDRVKHSDREAVVLVARSSGVPEGEARAVFDALVRAWPGHRAPPRGESATVEELIESPTSAIGRAAGVVAVLGPGTTTATIYRLGDALGTVLRPSIVLYEGATTARPSLEGDGVLVEERSADPAYLASALSALLCRQPVVQRLAGELNLAQVSLGGVQGQVTRWQDEMQLAASVQREFLPRGVPEADGLHVGVIFRPAGYVSGDIFDVSMVDEHRTAFFIADAVGHGVPAALLTLVIARSLRKTEGVGAQLRVLEPAEALANLNREFCERMTDRSRFATAVYGVFDARTNRVTLAGAGHPPPILSRGGRVERLETDGPLLGVFPEAEFTQVEAELNPGDVLVLFSDGFETAFPDPEDTGRAVRLPTLTYLDRLVEAGSDGSKLCAAVRRLEAQLDAQVGSLHQLDDVTALLLAPSGCSAVSAAA